MRAPRAFLLCAGFAISALFWSGSARPEDTPAQQDLKSDKKKCIEGDGGACLSAAITEERAGNKAISTYYYENGCMRNNKETCLELLMESARRRDVADFLEQTCRSKSIPYACFATGVYEVQHHRQDKALPDLDFACQHNIALACSVYNNTIEEAQPRSKLLEPFRSRPTDAAGLVRLAKAEAANKDYTRAVQDYKRALKLQPCYIDASYQLVLIALNLHGCREAKAASLSLENCIQAVGNESEEWNQRFEEVKTPIINCTSAK